jgi:transcriptional regulator with XRE-family HTH domain
MARGITGQKLALMAEISPAYLSEVERGQSEISSEKLLRIAQSLGVNVQSLLEETQEPQESSQVVIPAALQEAAEELELSFKNTVRLLQGRQSLAARRSSGKDLEWKKSDWISFYTSVKEYLVD